MEEALASLQLGIIHIVVKPLPITTQQLSVLPTPSPACHSTHPPTCPAWKARRGRRMASQMRLDWTARLILY